MDRGENRALQIDLISHAEVLEQQKHQSLEEFIGGEVHLVCAHLLMCWRQPSLHHTRRENLHIV